MGESGRKWESSPIEARSHGVIVKSLFAVTLLAVRAFGNDDLGDHPSFSHAMEVETRIIDGAPVLFQYREVRPDFELVEGNSWRRRISLDGEWDFRFEGDRGDRKVQVPHCWEGMEGAKFWDQEDISSANPARFDGAGWYRRQFECEKEEGKRYRIEFLGIRERARISLNGRELARHEGLGAPFSIDVTSALVAGENELKLKVLRLPNHRRQDDGSWEEIEGVHTPYPKAPDYWPYAGVTASVALWEENPLTIRKVQLRSAREGLEVRAIVQNQGTLAGICEVSVASSVLAARSVTQSIAVEPGQVRVVTFPLEIAKGAKGWTPQSPNLFQLQATLASRGEVLDGIEVRSGLREFQVAGEQLMLHREPIFLKGVGLYSETDRGAVLTRSEHRKLLELAERAGANFVRLQVRQREPAVYQLADEMGLMVTGEWGGFWYRERAMAAQSADPQSVYQSMGRVAVWDLMNHPSVVLWCLHNECHQFCPEYLEFLKAGRSLVRELDAGMLPITWAAWHPHQGEPHFEIADVVGFNEYRGAMDPFEELAPDMEQVQKENPGKPIVIMENGAWATKGERGQVSQKGSEDWQADLLRRQWEVLTGHSPPLAGYTYWLLKDYRSRKSYTGNRQANGWSKMGMYSAKGEPKLVRDAFKGLPVPEQKR